MKRIFTLSLTLGLLSPIATFAAPNISSVVPITAAAGVAVNLSASVNSAIPIQRCSLWVDLAEIGDMTVIEGTASRPYTFPSGGSRIAFVFCRDTSGGMAAGATTAINVSGATTVSPPLSTPTPTPPSTPTPTPTPTPVPVPTPAPSPDAEKLFKLICPANTNVDHVCHAVYYIGTDGKRHAFPNSRVFFTWYAGFDSVQQVTLEALSRFSLGTNVTYRPGIKMVKFTTDPKVYGVARGGVLRWIKSEELARAYYGDEWNKQIDDIPDTFYTNYTFGADINAVADYNPATETANSVE